MRVGLASGQLGCFPRRRLGNHTLEMALLRVGLGPVFLAPKRRFMVRCLQTIILAICVGDQGSDRRLLRSSQRSQVNLFVNSAALV